MKRLIIFMALLALVMFQMATAQSTLRRTYDDLNVDVWTDKDDGSNYYEGDDITIYFRASRDCYVTIYDLDSRGNINLIFPSESDGDHLVKGDEIYMIPERDDDYTLTLEGPPGDENIQMVAAIDYYPVPDWRGPMSVYDKDWGFKYDGDNEEFINRINQKYFPGDNVAFDHVSFYVAPKYYYKPVRADCSGNCGMVYIDYPYGCDVYVDGVFFGYAPLYMPAIYLGRHRITVYWGASIVYNDWIFVDAWNPFFVYTRPYYVYNYCYDRWYRHHAWDDYYHGYGPSRYKYKTGDFYTYSKPQVKRGYEVVVNDHAKYVKSKTYVADKETRITQYKKTFGYDAKDKTYMTTKFRSADESGKKRISNAEAYDKAGRKDVGSRGSDAGKQSTGKRVYKSDVGEKKQPVENSPKSKAEGGLSKHKKSAGSSHGGSVKQPANSPESKAKSGSSEAKSKSDGGSSKANPPAVKQRSGDSGSSKPSSGSSSPKQGGKPSGGGKKGK